MILSFPKFHKKYLNKNSLKKINYLK